MPTAQILYTKTDEAPALATYSLLPIVQAFTRAAGIAVDTRDISLAGRILASFPDTLTPAQRQADDLAELGEIAKGPEGAVGRHGARQLADLLINVKRAGPRSSPSPLALSS